VEFRQTSLEIVVDYSTFVRPLNTILQRSDYDNFIGESFNECRKRG